MQVTAMRVLCKMYRIVRLIDGFRIKASLRGFIWAPRPPRITSLRSVIPVGGALKKEIAIFCKMAIFHLRGYF